MELTPKKIFYLALGFVLTMFVLFTSGRIVEDNEFGNYQIKQAFVTGDISIRNKPGVYGQWFGELATYKYSDVIFLSSDDNDGGDSESRQAIRVQFPDGFADVSFVGQYELSRDPEHQLALDEKYSTNEAVKAMIRQQVIEAFKNTGSLFNSGDAYADKRSDFIRLAEEQVRNGLYVPEVTTVEIENTDGTSRTEKRFTYQVDENGNPIINKPSTLTQYGITFSQFNVKDMDFDDKLESLIEARKDAQKAQQDALTARAQGEAKVAEERARQEIEKIKEVTIAEKNKEVAVLNAEKAFEQERLAALTAIETAKKVRAEGEAQAAANRALVNAGLTPLEAATIDKETQIGVARELAKIQFPGMMIIGSGENGSTLDPFSAVGLQTFIEINKQLSTNVSRSNN